MKTQEESYDQPPKKAPKGKKEARSLSFSEHLSLFLKETKWQQVTLVLLFILFYFFRRVEIIGESMEPTLHNETLEWGLRVVGGLPALSFEDIIVFQNNGQKDYLLVKRVIGLPGDVIEIRENHVWVNHKQLNESYLAPNEITEGDINLVVPPDHYFVLGDNRQHSGDSRLKEIGLVKKEWILFRLFQH